MDACHYTVVWCVTEECMLWPVQYISQSAECDGVLTRNVLKSPTVKQRR